MQENWFSLAILLIVF